LGSASQFSAHSNGIGVLAAVQSVETTVEFGLELDQLDGPDLLMFFEEPEGFPNHLAG
jgi:hypothetical protein